MIRCRKIGRLTLGLLAVFLTAGWAGGPVVVELFTSQGCSSCPPAEAAIVDLAKEFGDSIIPLMHHVHYWDYLGWKDPFSSQESTDRQRAYSRAFGKSNVYTPQMVVEGGVEFNGSRRDRARQEIQARLSAGGARLDLARAPGGSARMPVIQYNVNGPLDARNAALMAVVFENAEPVPVPKGENRGRTMRGEFAVRSIKRVPLAAGGRGTVPLRIDPSWDLAKTGVACWVEAGGSPQILAAGKLYPLTDAR